MESTGQTPATRRPDPPTATTVTEIVLPGQVEPDGLQVRTRELPAPAEGQVLLRMEATGISFAEQQMRRGKYPNQPAFPFVPGYDVVGTVTATGPGVDTALIGQRFAAVTKTGGWASQLLVDAADLVAVPDDVDSAVAVTAAVNGITAWQMLHYSAKARRQSVIVVLGANGGVGSTLVQLARHAGMTVIGTASQSHHDAVREMGALPVDYREPEMYQRIRELAPDGVDAVFDHVGGDALVESWKLLRRGGTLVAYGSASTKNVQGNALLPLLKLFARLALWRVSPNGRSATFYKFWAGKSRRPDAFRARLHEDLIHVLQLVTDGGLVPKIAAEFPLTEAAAALAHAESGTVTGKVVLLPQARRS